jgi:hypothetical protein
VGAVRPPRCLECGCEAVVPGRLLGLHGHGTRARSLLGPEGPDLPPKEGEVLLRRYLCQRCGAVLVVGPYEVLPGLRYRATAVVIALAQLAEGRSSVAIRTRVSPQQILGHDGRRSWRSPARWARRAQHLWPWIRAGPEAPPETLALRAVRALASRAPAPTGRLLEDALLGAQLGGPRV